MSDLRRERSDLQQETSNLKTYQEKLDRKYKRLRSQFIQLGEEANKDNITLTPHQISPITIKRITKEQKALDKKHSRYFKELLQGPLDVSFNLTQIEDNGHRQIHCGQQSQFDANGQAEAPNRTP